MSALQIVNNVIPFSPLKFYYVFSAREGLKIQDNVGIRSNGYKLVVNTSSTEREDL